MERGSLQARRERLTELTPKVGPVTFAKDRVLAVPPPLAPLFPEAGMVRGSIVGCQGPTALSVALATVSAASADGCWLACVGVPSLGLRAADELGIALERLVMVAAPMGGSAHPSPTGNGSSSDVVASTMSALIDGFDLVMLRGAGEIRPPVARRLQARLQARGAILVVVGDPGPFICDVTVTGIGAEWEGLEDGAGRLARRRLSLSGVGRRSPRARRVDVWLPGADGGIEPLLGTDVAPIEITSAGDDRVALRQTG